MKAQYWLIIIISILYCVVTYIVPWWFIFKKEKEKSWYALIPFVNVYYYFKICKIPFWTIFIPIINIIVLWVSSYNLAKQYDCPKWQCALALIFPLFFNFYIAFSNKQIKKKVIETNYVKSNADIDALENELQKNSYEEYIENDNQHIIKNDGIASNTDKLIDDIENEIINDEVIYDEVDIIENNEVTKPQAQEEQIEVFDEERIDDLSLENLDKLEENIIEDNKYEKNVEKEVKDFKEHNASNTAIAFGGVEKLENTTNSKNEELKCPRCGASIVGANGFCPGCGLKL